MSPRVTLQSMKKAGGQPHTPGSYLTCYCYHSPSSWLHLGYCLPLPLHLRHHEAGSKGRVEVRTHHLMPEQLQLVAMPPGMQCCWCPAVRT
jgi:hypothetical protein